MPSAWPAKTTARTTRPGEEPAFDREDEGADHRQRREQQPEGGAAAVVQAAAPGGNEEQGGHQGGDEAERPADDLLGTDAQEQRHREDQKVA